MTTNNSSQRNKHIKKNSSSLPSVIESESDEEDNIEAQPVKITKKNKILYAPQESVLNVDQVVKKPMSEAKAAAMKKAQVARQNQLRDLERREQDEQAKILIERAYKDELTANLTKTMLPKYSKKIKQEILQKLKMEKLAELKKQYGYHTGSSEDDSSSGSEESEEEEEIIVSKKKKSKPIPIPIPKEIVKRVRKEKVVEPIKHVGILDRFRQMGF